MGWVAQSVQQLTTGWTVRDQILAGTRFSARPDRPWGPLSLLYNGYRVFPGGKVRPGPADHSPPSIAAVMEEWSYISTHPLGHTGPVTGSLYLFYCTCMLNDELLLRTPMKLCYCLADETELLKSTHTHFTDPMSVSRQLNMKQFSINTRQ